MNGNYVRARLPNLLVSLLTILLPKNPLNFRYSNQLFGKFVVLHTHKVSRLTIKKTKYCLPGQNILENGDADPTNRKDPKYVTHGIHPFKGKFYPQLAKSLMNMSGAPVGARLFDPYCGSGTTLLEGMLNGFSAYGCDVNPLAAKIAHAKTAILSESRYRVDHSIGVLLDRISQQQTEFPEELDQFKDETHTELTSWFPDAVLYKLNWLLSQIRLMGNPILVNFFEVITSSIIREISHQDPTDLRIRRRKETLQDAPVLELFRDRLEQQYARLRKYWSVAGRQPGKLIFPMVIQGDSRKIETIRTLGMIQTVLIVW